VFAQEHEQSWAWLRRDETKIIDQVPFITACAAQFDRGACERCPKGSLQLKMESEGQAAKPTLTVMQTAFCIVKVESHACAMRT
jgi:hypothetical protein